MGKEKAGRRSGKIRGWLIEIRKNQDKTQGQVAAAAGITQPSYFQIENGQINPAIATAKLIGAELGFPWTRFYDEDDGEAET